MKVPERKKRGEYKPKKADVLAFTNGVLTPQAKRLDSIVDKAFRINSRRKSAISKFDSGMEKLFSNLVPEDQGTSVVSVDGKRRVTKARQLRVRGNANAHKAKALIDTFVAEILSRKALSQDEQNMTTFLKNVIQTAQGKVIQTRSMVEFKRLEFSDPRLKEAQKLLNDAFDVDDSKTYYYCEVLDPESRKWSAA